MKNLSEMTVQIAQAIPRADSGQGYHESMIHIYTDKQPKSSKKKKINNQKPIYYLAKPSPPAAASSAPIYRVAFSQSREAGRRCRPPARTATDRDPPSWLTRRAGTTFSRSTGTPAPREFPPESASCPALSTSAAIAGASTTTRMA